ncbi:vam6/Vps39-like protein [Ornithodoros turicata]|uniref:vam6/Vps39-like protein n=1 Tax=Ornithodoros turicata TaxID=34597 RepID=UPI0031392639
MYDAYTVIPVLKKLPLVIESAAAYDDKLLIGTKQGHLLVYKLTAKGGADETKFDVQLCASNKSFAKKPIVQLAAIPELNLLISLSDNTVTVHSLNLEPNTPPIDCPALSKCRGCTLFAVNVQTQKSLTGEVTITLMLCAAVKRKLELFYWKNNTFCEHPRGLCVPDTPRAMVWCGNESLLVGFKSEYNIIFLSGDTKQLFPTGKQPEPLCVKLSDDSFALGRDEMIIFVNSEGQPTHKYAVHWTEPPICLMHDYPYLLGALSSGIEIRTSEPRMLIQRSELSKPRFVIPCKRGQLYVASSTHIWCLLQTPVHLQIPLLLKDKLFELALKLADLSNDTEAERTATKQHIKNLLAVDLFCKKKYEESMAIFRELETDPSHVIGLFPDLLPEEYRSTLRYPESIPEIKDGDLETGLYALLDYLVQFRCHLLTDTNPEPSLTAITTSSKTIQSKTSLLQIIDTTMLKCYLMTNVALVASLLRLQDNYCHLLECERALKKHQKLSELIILYQQKGQHRKALELMFNEAKKTDSPLKGHERTVSYLKHLGRDHIDLVFEFSKWVLAEHPDDGLKIFTGDQPEAGTLPPQAVLQFLTKEAPKLVIPYLENLIRVKGETAVMFHNTLLHKYREELQEYKVDGQIISSTERVRYLRRRLAQFLETSEHYTAENFPTHLLSDGLYEEAAIVMGRLGRHEDALTIYVQVLRDHEKAEAYCEREYARNVQRNKDVFLTLIQLHLYPSKLISRVLHLCPKSTSTPEDETPFQRRVDTALGILSNHVDKIDPLQALAVIPAEVPVAAVSEFFRTVLDRRTKELHDAELHKSLLFAEHLQVQERAIRCQALKVVVTELDICGVCQKRIGRSAFARFPDGVIVHYSCRDSRDADKLMKV